MKMYSYTAPSGVKVTQNVPPVDPRWWDNPRVHVVWSYLSWITMILAEHGVKTPRRLFRNHLSR